MCKVRIQKVNNYYRRNNIDVAISCKEISTTFLNIRDDLLEIDKEMERTQKFKCPELEISLNNVPVIALIDTGSQINAISAEWFNKNKHRWENWMY